MPKLELCALVLAITQCLVQAAPLEDRKDEPFGPPFKSVESQSQTVPSSFPGPVTLASQVTGTALASATDSLKASNIPAASAQTSGAQSDVGALSISVFTTITGASTTVITSGSLLVTLTTGGSTVVVTSTAGQPLSSGLGSETALSISGAIATTGSLPPALPTGQTATAAVSATGTGGSNDPSSTGSVGNDPASGSSGPGSTSPLSNSRNSSLSPGEIAAAVILPVLTLSALLFLAFCYRRPARAKYTHWRKTSIERTAYRRALNDPVMSFHQHANSGAGDSERLMPSKPRPLSFGFSNPIRPFPKQQRKPLSWDASRVGGEESRAIGMALPIEEEAVDGQHSRQSSISEVSEDSDIYGGGDEQRQSLHREPETPVSPMTIRR